MTTLAVQGVDIAVHEWLPTQATRSPVVCLASTGMSGRSWRKLAKHLVELGHRVFAPDLIGYGDSGMWPHARPFETRYDVEVATQLISLADSPVHIVGHSYGGRVGLAAAMQDPTRICSLSLFEPTCFGVLRSTGDADALGELLDHDRDQLFLDDGFGGSEPWMERFVDYWSGPGSWMEFSAAEQATWLRSGRKMFEEVRETALDDVPHNRMVEVLGEIPLLALSGAESTRAGRRCCAILGEVMPRGRHIEIADVGHMGPLLAASEVNALIIAHITTAEAPE